MLADRSVTKRFANASRRDGKTPDVKPIMLPLVLGLLVSFGCRSIPGQDVRYEPTPMPVVRALLELAEVGPHDVVYDLGSGDGRIPITAAKKYGARGVGIEIDSYYLRWAFDNLARAGVADRVVFLNQDLFESDISPATVVTLFLLPRLNQQLIPKLKRELRRGSRVVSHQFDMGDQWPPDETRDVDGLTVYLWTIR